MSHYVLGLDIGITSVGYGIIDLDTNDFIDYGVRLFKEGTAANNEDRRNSRSRRRLLSRKHTRLMDMQKVLKEAGIMTESYRPLPNVYEIRKKGLTQELTNEELTAAVLHITKHRGSVIETVEDDEAAAKETGELKSTLHENALLLANNKFVCEIQLERLNTENKIRNHKNNFKTKDYVAELKEILNHQNLSEEVKNKIIQIVERRRAYYEGPGSFNSPTPYGRFIEVNGQVQEIDLIEKMRGKCSVYPDEFRAPKMSISADLFNILNDFNNLLVQGEKLQEEDKKNLLKIINDKGSITLRQISKKLEVNEDEIKGYRIDKKGKALFTEFKGYKILKKLFLNCGQSISLEDYEMLDEIIEIVTKKKGIDERKDALKELKWDLSDDIINSLSEVTGIVGYHSLSLKAIRELDSELYKTSLNQMQLLHELKMFDKNRPSYKGKKNIVADPEAILSPVAKRAQNETFKVINALRKKYGEFDSIVVEMTRDKNSQEQKKRINDSQKALESLNKEVDQLLQQKGYDPQKVKGKTKQKVRLYMMQEGKSAYTLQELDLHRVIKDDKYTEIDHIIPISISLDDSQSNKVLALHSENQQKGSLTPFMAFHTGRFAGMGCTWNKFKENVLANKNYNHKKKNNLLDERDINKFSVIQEFINRNLVDTSYANRVVLNTLTDYFKDNEIDTKVHTVNGKLTDLFRKRINLKKDRNEDYLHHAIDALIVASIKKLRLLDGYLAKYGFETLYDEMTGEIKEIPEDKAFFDDKYIRYILNLKTIYESSNMYYRGILEREELIYQPIKISHKIDTKPNRKVSDETIYSTRIIDNEDHLIEKYSDIYDPKFKNLTEDILNGEKNKYLMEKNDPQTFNILKQIIFNHYNTYKDSKEYYKIEKKKEKEIIKLVGINPLSLYKEENGPIKKYSKKGNGPVIMSMKYDSEKLGNHIDITPDSAKNKKVILKQISPYRTDFYKCSDEKFRFVTVRYKDVHYQKSIDKYCIDKEWYQNEKKNKKIDEKAEFLFSMHHDELIGITRKESEQFIYDESKENHGDPRYHDGIKPEILKFTATNNDTKGKIEVKPLYTYCKKQLMLSVLNVKDIKKYATDVLGNLYEVEQNELKLEF